MSKHETVKITCPRCKKESDFGIWSSINTALNPELKEKVRDCSLFLFECPECGEKTSINYGFLYHQMEDNIMIHYANSEENAKQMVEMYNNRDDKMIRLMRDEGYIIRVVLSREELLEKIAILNAGLDDRIIELLKLMYEAQVVENYEVDGVYFVVNGDEKIIEFTHRGRVFATAEVDDEVLSGVESDFADKLPKINEDNAVIDSEWAVEFLKEQGVI